MFDEIDGFLAMGGNGVFVWGSYGICFGLMAVLAIRSVIATRARRRDLALMEGRRVRNGRPATDSASGPA